MSGIKAFMITFISFTTFCKNRYLLLISEKCKHAATFLVVLRLLCAQFSLYTCRSIYGRKTCRNTLFSYKNIGKACNSLLRLCLQIVNYTRKYGLLIEQAKIQATTVFFFCLKFHHKFWIFISSKFLNNQGVNLIKPLSR